MFSQIRRSLCTIAPKSTIQVTVLGADTPGGQMVSFLLKQNPKLSVLHLQGTSRVEPMGIDLSHFDTECKVQTYYDMESVSKSVKSAEVVLMMGLSTGTTRLSIAKQIMAEGPRVLKLAEVCSRFAPKALLVVAVSPISVTLPMVAEVYKQTDWYHPGRLLGSVAVAQVKANALAGHFQNLDPQTVHVPIVGGPDLDCAIPLFSKASPGGMPQNNARRLLKRFRGEIGELPYVSQAVGLNRMVTGIARGMCGEDGGDVPAFIRSRVLNVCRHLVSNVKVSKTGIYHNYGLPKLNREELVRFEDVTHVLREREDMASQFANRKDKCALPEFMKKELEAEKQSKCGVVIR